jgi:hypothetical protein
VELLTAGADCRLVSVALLTCQLGYEYLNVPSTIGAAIPEFGHVVSILNSAEPEGVTAQVFGLGRAREAIRAATSRTDLWSPYRPTKSVNRSN